MRRAYKKTAKLNELQLKCNEGCLLERSMVASIDINLRTELTT